MISKEQTAVDLFLSGYNCAQSVLAAYCEDSGLERDTAFKIACGFGGGFRCGEVCGAVSGATMVIGLKCGQYLPGDTKQKGFCYMKTLEFIDKFKAENGSILCRELLGTDIWTADPEERAKTQELFKTFCPKMVASAVRILETMEFERKKS
jgi:C_GCAxxG_C_C family probable redox protein